MGHLSIAIKRFIMDIPRPSKTANIRRLSGRGERIESFIIREAIETDIPALAALHVKTWSQTYWNVLRPPTYKIREWQWRDQFKKNDGSWFCFVIDNSKGQLVGFAKGKKYSHSDIPDFSGELNKIYILREYQRLGLGKRLLGHVARKFSNMGINNMVLFGVAENPSCLFHEATGGEKLFSKKGEFHGGYCWRNLQQLVSICPVE
jgi:ribosomal protein S18 acetylase RimI-like enzyme